MFLLWHRQLPRCGDWTPASVPPPTEGRSSPTNTSVFPPSSFVLLSFACFYIFFSSGQVLLSALSWCSACTSVSEGVFLMYPWKEVDSTSTCSSAILFSPDQSLIFNCQHLCIFMIDNIRFVLCSVQSAWQIAHIRYTVFQGKWIFQRESFFLCEIIVVSGGLPHLW